MGEGATAWELAQRLSEAEATIEALLGGQIDAVVDSASQTPVLLWKAQEALKASEERYRRIIETTSEGVWMIDADNMTTFMNLRMAQMLGCEATMGIGSSPTEFLSEDGRAKFAAHVQQPTIHQAETQYIRSDGTTLWTLVEVSPVFDRDGRYEGSLAMVMDTTERKRAGDALRASENRFQRLWDSGIILLTVSDLAGKIIEINDAGLRMLGYSREELLASGLGWADLTPPGWENVEASARAQLAATGMAPPWEKELIRKDGSHVSILAAAAILDGVEGIAIAVDLSDRKRAERALLERVRIAALTADVAMLLTHEAPMRSTLQRCAQAFVQHLDIAFARVWTLDEASGVLELQARAGTPAPSDALFERIKVGALTVGKIAQERQPIRINDPLGGRRKDDPVWEGITAFAGHPLIVNEKLVGVLAIFSRGTISDPVFAGLGTISSALAVAIERKLMMTANAALELQLRQSQKMEAVGRLAGGIAHDFNNILTVILSYGEFLREGMQELDPARADVDEICKAGTRAAGLTRQLLMFSRQQVLQPKVLELAELTTNMEGMLRRVLGEDVELIMRHQRPACRVRVDLGSFEQVIMNLAVNARDAMPTGGVLTIETRNETIDASFVREHLIGAKPGPHVVLSVTDTGSGMAAAVQARIFEPFFTTKEVGQGTGLGLSTVFGIVQQSGGGIRVRSEPGQGTTFSIYVPCVETAADALALRPSVNLRGTETILLVEDEDQVRAVTCAILQRHGYRVIEQRSAPEALASCAAIYEPIHLLLTDVVMPHMSGPELARRLLRARPDLKILCMSGYTDDSMARHGVHDDHIALLQKPFTSESLTSRVRQVLDAKGPE